MHDGYLENIDRSIVNVQNVVVIHAVYYALKHGEGRDPSYWILNSVRHL